MTTGSDKLKPAAVRIERSLLQRAIAGERPAVESMFRQFIPERHGIIDAVYLGTRGFPPIVTVIVLIGFAELVRDGILAAYPSLLTYALCALAAGLILDLVIGWLVSVNCFAALATDRVAAIWTTTSGGVDYQDCGLDGITSNFVYQNSLVYSYLLMAVSAAVLWFGVGWSFARLTAMGILSTSPSETEGAIYHAAIFLPILAQAAAIGLGAVFGYKTYHRFFKSGIVLAPKKGIPVWLFTDRRRLYMANRLFRNLAEYRDQRRRSIRHSN